MKFHSDGDQEVEVHLRQIDRPAANVAFDEVSLTKSVASRVSRPEERAPCEKTADRAWNGLWPVSTKVSVPMTAAENRMASM